MREELFPPQRRVRVSRRYLAVAMAVAEKLGEEKLEILVYGEYRDPWFCFDVGERKFAIWKHTGDLYECEPDGAVEEDPIEVRDL